MEHKETISYRTKKMGRKNVIFSFLAVADSIQIPLNMNSSANTTSIAKPLY
jgi:hypothetical protein